MRSGSPSHRRIRLSLTPSPVTSQPSAYAHTSLASSSAKVWELPRLIDLLAYCQPRQTARLKPQRTQTEGTEVMRAILSQRKEKSQDRERPRLRQRLLKKAGTTRELSPVPQAPSLEEGIKEYRKKQSARPVRRKQASLQPLRLAGLQGLSDPCFHVLNYSSSQDDSRPIRSSYRALKAVTPEPNLEMPECVGETMRLTHAIRPPQVRYQRGYKRKSVVVLPRSMELQGWADDTSPRDFSPLVVD